MSIKIIVESLKEIMQSFYTLTGIRIIIFDTEYNEVLSCPPEDSKLCSIMKYNPSAREKCKECDMNSFKECRRKGELIIYKCHAGMVETATPLKENGGVIGYAMFGQIVDNKNKDTLREKIAELSTKYGLDTAEALQAADYVKYKSVNQIYATSKILETCASYILLKELVSNKNDKLFSKINKYIEDNLSGNITTDTICKEFNISRSSLYRMFEDNNLDGIAKLIKHKRMEKAKKLIRYSDIAISEIATVIGFDDYNYFSKVFKHTYGISPSKFRKSQ